MSHISEMWRCGDRGNITSNAFMVNILDTYKKCTPVAKNTRDYTIKHKRECGVLEDLARINHFIKEKHTHNNTFLSKDIAR